MPETAPTVEIEPVHLKRQLGLLHGIIIICGLVIGSGIYISPTAVMRESGSPGLCLIIWVLAAVFAILGALSFAELGTSFPRSGEKYVYLQEAFGPTTAFVYMWMYLMLIRPGANAIKCLTISTHLLQLWYPNCEAPSTVYLMLAVLMSSSLTALNCLNVKWSVRGQAICTALSTCTLLSIGLTGLVSVAQGDTNHISNPFAGSTTDPLRLVLAFYGARNAFWGWSALNFLVEELKDPYKNLPRAIVISMTSVTVVYLLANFGYTVVVGADEMGQSRAVAVLFAQNKFGVFAWLMPLFIAASCISSFNSGTIIGSRLAYSAARRGHLPRMFALINIRFLSPMVALLVQGALCIILCLATDVFSLMYNLQFAGAVFDSLGVMALLYLRYKRPDMHRPLKVPLVLPIVFLLGMLATLVIPLVTDPAAAAVGMAVILLTGLPYYYIVIVRQMSWKKGERWLATVSLVIQKLLYSSYPATDNFDGQNTEEKQEAASGQREPI